MISSLLSNKSYYGSIKLKIRSYHFLDSKVFDLDAINNKSWTVLHDAASSGMTKLCRLVLELCPSIVASRTAELNTPIHLAVAQGRLETLLVLLEAIPDAEDRKKTLSFENQQGKTALSLALNAVPKNREIISALITAGADLEQTNESEHTALHQAILKEDSSTAIFLLENGADINAR